MPITKPYHRIWRPLKGYSYSSENWIEDHPVASLDYLKDNLFANQLEINSLVISARLLIHDLYVLFNYIEPNNNNLTVFSHRIYELFLRATTEVESNFKGIFTANAYNIQNKANMNEYFKLKDILKLSEYRVNFSRWNSDKEFKPFDAWKSSSYQPLPWYKAYNNVKHNRYTNFSEANLENLMNAVSGLLSLLHAQIGIEITNVCFEGVQIPQIDQNHVNTKSFNIYAPSFPEEEQYDFIWDSLKTSCNPVENYTF